MVAIKLSPRIFQERRAQFITLQSNSNFTISRIVVCAPNSSRDRDLLWHKIINTNIPSEGFILTGDFNMVEEDDDKLRSIRNFTSQIKGSTTRERGVSNEFLSIVLDIRL